jgi:succinate dehydrogenase / fumarate reductase cytochrome b subunit
VDGVEMRDLHKLVWQTYQSPAYVIWYVVSLTFLGFHLRHGFWSAFQSLGVSHPRISPLISTVGILTAACLAVGFIGIPIWIYIMGA